MIRYFYIFALAVLGLVSVKAANSTATKPPKFPFITEIALKEIIGNDAWSWKWKQVDKSLYTPEIQSSVASDIKSMVAAGQLDTPRFDKPMILYAILQNPSRPLVYFILVPDTLEGKSGSLDINLVYAYDTKSKSLIFKTYVDPES